MVRMIRLEAAGLSNPGCRRTHNEDRILLDTSRGVFVVADGMGGERCGDLAAETAVRAVGDYISRGERSESYAWPFGYDQTLSAVQNRAANAVRVANRRIWECTQTQPDCEGMGSTISALFIDADEAAIGNIGDSRVYLIRNGDLRVLTRDDAVVANLLEAGLITAAQSRTHPMRNVLTLALGQAEDVTVQLVGFPVRSGDRLLLCSDGLHGVIDEAAIHNAFENQHDLRIIVQTLIDAACEQGGPDNVSCIVVGCE
jgi:protein phosphatase